MVPKVERVAFNFGISGGRGEVLNFTVNYAPVILGSARSDLTDQFTLPYIVREEEEGMSVYMDVAERAERLRDQIERRAAEEEIEIDGRLVRVTKFVGKLWVFADDTPIRIQVDYRRQFGTAVERVMVSYPDLTEAQQRLLDSIVTSLDSFAWRHIRQRFQVAPPSPRARVFISYRKGHEAFTAALATRLGREGFQPWFDEWEMRAGDSLPGKIEKGFASSVAFIVVMTKDYVEGKWATEELEAAIHRRVEQEKSYPIIPVLLEECEKPQLIRHLLHVDFRDQDPQTFEAKMAELIDGINRLDRNPFR